MESESAHEEYIPTPWSVTVTGECVCAAAVIMDYLIKQKLVMMDVDEIGPNELASVKESRAITAMVIG